MADQSMTGASADAIELLTSQHREVEQLWSQLRAGTGGGELRNELTRRLIALISQHDAIETQMLYPTVREVAAGDQLADHSLQEHQEIRKLLKQVDGEDVNDHSTLSTLTTAMEQVLHHAREEEQQIFPRLRDRFGSQQLLELGSRMEQAIPMAPTHPHPSTPNNPVGASIAGAVTGVVDKARDALRGDR